MIAAATLADCDMDGVNEFSAQADRKDSGKAERRRRRLRRRNEFDYVKRSGITEVGRFCVVTRAPAKDNRLRSAIVVSRYFSKKAVVRNRVRRLIREALRDLLPASSAHWVVIRPRKSIRAAKAYHVQRELQEVFVKLGLIAQSSASVNEQDRPS